MTTKHYPNYHQTPSSNTITMKLVPPNSSQSQTKQAPIPRNDANIKI